MKYGDTFELENGNIAKVSGVYSKGFHYHTLNADGDCIAGEQYMLHSANTPVVRIDDHSHQRN
jgi:hypothetical protein